jgi:hypothetical protein
MVIKQNACTSRVMPRSQSPAQFVTPLHTGHTPAQLVTPLQDTPDSSDDASIPVVKYRYVSAVEFSHHMVVPDLQWLPGIELSTRGKVNRAQDSAGAGGGTPVGGAPRECSFFATTSGDGKVGAGLGHSIGLKMEERWCSRSWHEAGHYVARVIATQSKGTWGTARVQQPLHASSIGPHPALVLVS